MPGEDLLGYFAAAVHSSPAHPSYQWAPQAARGTEGGLLERGGGGGQVEDLGENSVEGGRGGSEG